MDDDITPSPSEDNTSSTLPATCRRDGWTPFYRRLFLQVLAETGRVTRACEYCRLTPQSAYALRNRDSLFAAGWDAACHLARNPLADALHEQAADGLTETIRRNGEIVAERHRHDSRLSIAVLHRLDKRCDRAEDHGARYLPLIARWDEWLDLIAKGDDAGALALLDNADPLVSPHHQLDQLPLGENPTDAGHADDDGSSFWQEKDGRWMTDFPPPPEFDGIETGAWGEDSYSRDCTPHESDLLDRMEGLEQDAVRRRAERRRDSCIAGMMADLAECAGLPPDPPSD